MDSGHEWRVSSYSGANNNCVEISPGSAWLVRDTKDRAAGYLTVSPDAWASFLHDVREH